MTSPDQSGTLLPRYRRAFTFGGILDDTFAIYRQAWLPLLVVMAIAGVLNLLARAVQAAAGATTVPITRTTAPQQIAPAMAGFGAATLLVVLMSWLALLPSLLAVTSFTNDLMRGQPATLSRAWDCYLGSFRGFGTAVGSSVLVFLRGIGLGIAAVAVWLVGLVVVGPLIALVCVIVWVANSRARRRWLKWLIILGTPYGLVIYYTTRWALATATIALERKGPAESLRRSAQLVSGSWFRVAGILFFLTIIVYFMQSVPVAIVSIPLAIGRLGQLTQAGDPLYLLVTSATGALGLALFGSLPAIGATIVYTDLRNRAEGADLIERLEALQPVDPGEFPTTAIG